MTQRRTTPASSPAGLTPAPGSTRRALALTPLEVLQDDLESQLSEPARAWLRQAVDEAADHPGTHGPISVWELRLAEAGRRCGTRHADAARLLILRSA
ncbi:sugar phosphate isomerase, partial [Streptomyces bobili]